MRVYIVTEEELNDLNRDLELRMLRDNNIMKLPEDTLDRFEKDGLYRGFNLVIRNWQEKIKKPTR